MEEMHIGEGAEGHCTGSRQHLASVAVGKNQTVLQAERHIGREVGEHIGSGGGVFGNERRHNEFDYVSSKRPADGQWARIQSKSQPSIVQSALLLRIQRLAVTVNGTYAAASQRDAHVEVK